MKPVVIFRHAPSEGPGYFASTLERKAIPWTLVALDEGRAVPRSARACSGLVLMGGPMSANDALPWIAPVLALIADAVRQDVPVLGHCLGGQLMARAFGGTVQAAPAKEIGWGEVRASENAVAREWLGPVRAFEAFHWHGEAFSIPPGGTRVLENAHCANQAFALGRHFGMQCHVEMTGDMVRDWLRGGAGEIAAASGSPAVQDPAEIERDLERRIDALHAVADRIYDRWIEGLSRG
ncbi:MAG: type 1 glutamine amidotransferase [Betaproteobacteria bacterium]|nr:type 1 glutamine amidotransferase [Betaproteobacteria bacterium]MDH5219996.1 type 1 glutamine amidotransferase [Betaproteobacteria bacterium]MDH5350654.1 type 1 glutamine amidotransferase [Betaproteobacteria bacterium]